MCQHNHIDSRGKIFKKSAWTNLLQTNHCSPKTGFTSTLEWVPPVTTYQTQWPTKSCSTTTYQNEITDLGWVNDCKWDAAVSFSSLSSKVMAAPLKSFLYIEWQTNQNPLRGLLKEQANYSIKCQVMLNSPIQDYSIKSPKDISS